MKTDTRLGVKQDEEYRAIPYWLDPHEKVELVSRIPDGYDPACTQYRSDIEILRDSQ